MYDPANDAYASPEDPTAYNIRPISPVHGLPIGIDPLTGLPWGVDPNQYDLYGVADELSYGGGLEFYPLAYTPEAV
jgi:hypothetical protein